MKRSLLIAVALVMSLAAQARPTPSPTPNPQPAPAATPATVPASSTNSETLPPANARVKKPNVDIFTTLKLRAPVATDKIYRVDGMSSQPWARMAGSHPGWSEFPRPETANRGLNIISINF